MGCQFFLCWLLYFYTASAMRESVLKVNGSHIRPWCAVLTSFAGWPGLPSPAWHTCQQLTHITKADTLCALSKITCSATRIIGQASGRCQHCRFLVPHLLAPRWIHHHYWSIGTALLSIEHCAIRPTWLPVHLQVDPPPLLVHRYRHAHAVAAGGLALGGALGADLHVVGHPAGGRHRHAEPVRAGC